MKATTTRASLRWASSALLLCHLASADATPVADLVLSEVFYDRVGADDGFEWVELFNGSRSAIDLSSYSLGYGGASYASAVVSLFGVIDPGDYVVIGGPLRDASNASPSFHQVFDFEPDLENSGSIADGIALFALLPSEIDANSIPSDAVVYGTSNSNLLLGPNGDPSPVHVVDAPSGSSLSRTAANEWIVLELPNPGSGVLTMAGSVPEPATALLLIPALMGIAAVQYRGVRRALPSRLKLR
jgi:hypothetical protein